MNIRIYSAVLMALLCVNTAPVFGQGFTTDNDAWDASVCGVSFDLNLESLTKFDGSALSADEQFNFPVTNGQNLGWGTLSQANVDPDGVIVNTGDGFIFVNPQPNRPISAELDPTLGVLSGFCFRYGNVPAEIQLLDGTTVVDSVVTGPAQTDPVNGTPTFICWENTAGVNVTSIQILPADASPALQLAILGGELRFGDCDANDGPSCFDQLTAVRDRIERLSTLLQGRDGRNANRALCIADWMMGDVFWEQPSRNRLSQYGGSMFIGAAYVVCYLERIDDPSADALIDELMVVLECIVDYEIEYAIANGGNSCYIENAEYFADLGEIIDDDFDNEVIATLAYRLAWLHAYYSTQD